MPNLGAPRRQYNAVLYKSRDAAGNQTVSLYDDAWILQESKTTASVPNWKALIKAGSDATGTYTRVFHDFKGVDTGGFFSLTRSDPFRGFDQAIKIEGSWFVGTSIDDPVFPDSSAADNLALTKLYQNIRAEQVKMSGQVFLGEIRETIHMIKHPAQAFRRGIDAYVSACRSRCKGMVRSSDRVHRVLSDTWLEYKFGWNPLIADIRDGIAAYNNVISREPRLVVKGKGETPSSSVTLLKFQYLLGSAGTPFFWFDRFYRRDNVASTIYRAGLKSTRNGNKRDDLFDSFGFKFEEFVPAVWELIPYSFLVDYFTNVGDLLSAAATDTSAVTWVNISRKKVVKQMIEMRPDVPKSIQTYAGTGFTADGGSTGSQVARIESTQYSRVSTGLMLPKFTVTFPGEGSLRWLNIAALAAGRFL